MCCSMVVTDCDSGQHLNNTLHEHRVSAANITAMVLRIHAKVVVC